MFKIDIAVKEGKDKGKTFHIESESQAFIGMKIGDTIKGKDVKSGLEGYEFVITGASDKAGFPALPQIEGAVVKRVVLKYGRGMKQRYPHSLILRKRVHGNTISADISQINLVVKKQGSKMLSEIFGKTEKQEEKKEE
jgi:small subunit ribosomal protein S6e